MLERFYPDREYGSVEEIDFEELYREGIRGVMLDIDNTLVPHGAPADERICDFFKKLHGLGLETCLVSNNKEPRVKSFAGQVKSPYIFKANKPGRGGYLSAMERMGTEADTTVFVGDQLFTDIWGARRVGVQGFLVSPIHPREEIQIVLKRKLERIVLKAYHKAGAAGGGARA